MAAVKVRSAKIAERQHRVLAAALVDDVPDGGKDRDPDRPRREAAAPLDQGVRQPAEEERGEQRTGEVEAARRVRVEGLGDRLLRDDHGEHGERQVDQEDPAPAGVLDQEAAEERPDRGGDAAEPGPTRRSPSPGRRATNAPWIIARLPGVSSAAPTPWRMRAAISTLGGRGEPAQQRRDREPDGADHEDPSPAEPVAERAAEQDQAGQREQVAVGDPLQLGERRVEVLADGRAARR